MKTIIAVGECRFEEIIAYFQGNICRRFLVLLCHITMVTHPHPNPPLEGEGILCLLNPPLEGEGIFSLLHLQGGGREGDGVRKRTAMLKC